MAIVKMKRLRVMALAQDRDVLLRQLLRLGCVEISEPDSLLADPQWTALLHRASSGLPQARTEIADVSAALNAAEKYGGVRNGLLIQRRPISEKEFLSSGTADNARAAAAKINGLTQTLTRLQDEEARLSARRAGLTPWAALDVPLEQPGTEHTLFRLGVVPGGADVGQIRNGLAASGAAAELLEISADRQLHYLFLICLRSDEEPVTDLLRSSGFSAVSFPDASGTAAETLCRLDRSLEANRKQQADTRQALAGCAGLVDLLRVYADRLAAEAAQEENAARLMTDETIVFFQGWCPAEQLGRVEQLLEEKGCAWEACDPTEEEIPGVPVQLKNNWFTRPLSMVTEMYSLPAYTNVDPNPLMAPFFILFYGVMMADMGYGLLMILLSVFVTRKYRPKGSAGNLFSLMGLCGVSTFVMGAVTGGFFGDFLTQVFRLTGVKTDFALPALFTPLDDTLMILLGSMALGLVQIVTGMAISFVRKLRAGRWADALFEEVTWWIVFVGIGLSAAGVTSLILCAGAVLVVAGPLITGTGVGKITGVFSSIYSHVTGYFGDILSYSRLMALMLAGSVIAQVFNTLGAIPGNLILFLVISMAGNALNFALNLLGCYVHDLRLQCLEFFGKFYEDGGKPFRPLAIDPKYVDIEKNPSM